MCLTNVEHTGVVEFSLIICSKTKNNNFLISQLINAEFVNLFYGTSPGKQITAGQKKKTN